MIKLSKRLKRIADLIDNGVSVIDVGTDHGYVPNFLCINNISKDIIATDISENSLNKSIQLTQELNNEKYIKNILSNGIVKEPRGNIIIAGLGGIQIAEIIKNQIEVCQDAKKLILQPMQKTSILRRELMDNCFEIFDEDIIYEDDKFFEILLATYAGDKVSYSDKDLYISKILVNRKNEIYHKFLLERKEILEDILNKFISNNQRALARRKELKLNLKYLEEAINAISS